MCYSAQVSQALRRLARRFGAEIDYRMFDELLAGRLTPDGIDDSIKLSKALESNFLEPRSAEERSIKTSIDTYQQRLTRKLETELFAQKKRLADAERKLKEKPTKKASEDQRIATKKIDWLVTRLADMRRTELNDEDSRIFPFWHAPVIVMEGDRKIIRPMRYHCRPAGKPASIDRKFDGLYNARKDSLDGFWSDLFGSHHAIAVVTSFFENVALHDFERRDLKPGEQPQNLVVHFNPQPPREMLVACLWSHWREPNAKDLCSFAAITDDPPPEIAATGHNRCIVAIKEENMDAWLSPEPHSKAELLAVLNDRPAAHFEHRIAA
jgi:putative SOS response-associated peptidase YedK